MKIPVNLNEVEESKPVPAGRYSLTIASAEQGNSQKGNAQIKVSIGIDGHDNAPNVSHYISLPGGGDPDKDAFKALMLKRFLAAFKIPYSAEGFEVEDFPGARCECELSLSEPDDNGNVYNRLVLPRLKDEGGASASRGRAAPPKR